MGDRVDVERDDKLKVGVIGGVVEYKEGRLRYGLFECLGGGVGLGVNRLKGYVNEMKYVFRKEGGKSVGGFGSIGSMLGKVWEWVGGGEGIEV